VAAALLAPLQGLIAGLVGMDAAPIAIAAYSRYYGDPKRVTANTAATALLVSLATLLCYSRSIAGANEASMTTILLLVAVAGVSGGVTGAKLMHRVQPVTVKRVLEILLVLASAEVYIKILYATVNSIEELTIINTLLSTWILYLLAGRKYYLHQTKRASRLQTGLRV